MRASRSAFLKGLGTRLQSDLSRREAERDEESPETRLDESEVEYEPPREQIAADQIDTAAASPAAQIAAQRDAGSDDVAPVQLPRQPGDTMAPVGLSPDSGEELGPYASASWAEAGMPLRLRDAIASVRRISHELYQGAPSDPDATPAPPLAGHVGDDDFLSDRDPASGSRWDDSPAGLDDRPTDGHGQVLADQIGSHPNEILFDNGPVVNSLSTNNQLHEFERAFQREQIELEEGAAPEEPTPGHELVLEDDEHTRVLDDGAAYQEPRTGDEATRELMRTVDADGDEEPSRDLGEELHDRLPARRGATTGYGVHVTALAAAIVFVALAGFGFGMLSDTAAPERPAPMRDTATAAPAPPSARLSPLPAATRTLGPLDELVTVRVAPPPGDALAEPASVAPTRTLPLPPPPKPDVPQAATDQAPGDSQLREALDAAAIAPSPAEEPADEALSAPSEAEGTGGPFEPLFAKLPASRAIAGQVLVHYKANAAGGPATAMHLVRQLEAAGFSVEAQAVQFPIAGNSIRYFFPGDRDQAEALRASLERELPGGAALSVIDFSSFEPKPQEGYLEVWLRS